MEGKVPKFPLPQGHVFGLNQLAVHYHDGRAKLDGLALKQWQNRFAGGWRRPWMHPNGVYDQSTQRAVLEVQTVLGVPRTGVLGPREWAAVWEVAPPAPEPKPEPPPRKQRKKLTHADKRSRREYWHRYSEWRVEPGSDPEAPDWFPGRPFGPRTQAGYVREVQHLLGFRETGLYSKAMGRRVAGLQRAHGLPESGVVDARTAHMLESLRR